VKSILQTRNAYPKSFCGNKNLSCKSKSAKIKSILTILTAVLFGFSFTFSSCKACKKETKPAGRDDKASTEGNGKPKNELSPEEVKKMLNDVARNAVAVYNATYDAFDHNLDLHAIIEKQHTVEVAMLKVNTVTNDRRIVETMANSDEVKAIYLILGKVKCDVAGMAAAVARKVYVNNGGSTSDATSDVLEKIKAQGDKDGNEFQKAAHKYAEVRKKVVDMMLA
jgi:hypothetical protein